MTSTNNLLNKGCRTCLNAVKGWKPLSTKTRDYKKCLKSYAELLEEVTKINIKDAKYRKLPQLICGNCSRLLKSAYAFIQQAVEVQDKLCSTLNDEKLYSLQEMQPCKEIKIEKNEQKLNMENEDCLQETQIDIESCMETQVYIKSGGNTEDHVRKKYSKTDTKEITNNLLNKGCRTCLNAVKGWKPLSTKTRDYKKCLKSYAELLEEVTKINIKDAKYRKLPQLICGNCSRLLKSAYAFIQQAVEVQDKLCSTLNDEKLYSLQEMQPCKEIKIEKNEQKLNMENEDCLQETQIDIESCMETQVYIKSGGNTEDHVRKKYSKTDTKEIQTEKKSSTFELLKCTTKSQVESNKLDEYESELALSDSSECKETKTKKLSNKKCIKNKKSSLTSENKLSKQNEEFLDVAVPCNKCNKIFKNSKLLAVHQKISHVPEERKCTCHLCGKKFTRYCNMYKHMRTFHGPETVTLVSKRPESDYIYNCDKCPKKYSRKKSLVYHKKLKHCPVKVVKEIETREEERKSIDKGSLCPICGSSFTSKNQLTVHLRRHTGEKPFKCNLCDRAFLLVTQLNSHKRLHTGEKPYKCQMCGKAFRVSDDLRQHMRTHTNIRSHKCNQCERSFKYPQDLKIHLRSHTGERPYTCADCGDSFQRYNALRLHRIRMGHLDNLLQNTKKI